MNLVIIEQPLNNRGDESAHKALVRYLKKELPNCSIKVLFVGEKNDSIKQISVITNDVIYINKCNRKWLNLCFRWTLKSKIYFFLFFLFPSSRDYLKILKTADWVIVAPGGINMGGFQTWPHLQKINVAKIINKKIAYFARSFGPFPIETDKNKKFKDYSLKLLNYFSFISIRDKRTEKIAQNLGIEYISTIDTAFLDSPKVEIPPLVKKIIGDKEYIVFVPNVLKWHYAYQNVPLERIDLFYKTIINYVLKEYPDLNIVMLPQTFNEKDPLWNDINYFYHLQKNIGSERLVIVPDTYSSDIQQTIISSCKLVIGARYHSIVFSVNQNVPFVALSYEHKITGLLEDLEKTNCIVPIQNIFINDKETITAAMLAIKLISFVEKDEQARSLAKEKAAKAMNEFIKMINS